MNVREHNSDAGEAFDARFATPEELAGPAYDKLISSKESVLAHLHAGDSRVTLAAVLVCVQMLDPETKAPMLEACRALVKSDADDSIRSAALGVIGLTLEATTDPQATTLAAHVVLDPRSSESLRTDAYWVLRELQYGVRDVDFDGFLRGMIHGAKKCLQTFPGKFNEQQVRAALVPAESFPDDFWDGSDEIDWDFVRRMAKT